MELGPPGDNGTVTRLTVARARDLPRDLLAFALSREPRSAPAARMVAADLMLAIAAAAASLAITVTSGHGQAASVNLPVAALLFGVITTAPLALRRVFPLAVFWVVLAGIVFGSQYSNLITFLAVVLSAYSAVVHSRFRGAALISVPLAALLVTAVFPDTTPPLPGRLGALFVLIPVLLVGNAMHLWRRRAGDSQTRLQRIEAEHEAATIRALAAERAHIAGELHDVVTHNVSVMVVQAGAARRVLAASPADATAALLAVEASGRAAMVELQHLLGLLAPLDGIQVDGRTGEPDPALLRPQPGLDQVQPLVDRVTATGLQVDLIVTGQPGVLSPGIALTAYRVVQEALTNVMKHASQAGAVVTLHYRGDELVIDVSDDGARGGRAGSPSAQPAGSGRGLLGLRERVSLYGGDFDAGPRPIAGWRVTARLPHEPQPAGSAPDVADRGVPDIAGDGGSASVRSVLPARS
jgi:signal transduction histidine kinase